MLGGGLCTPAYVALGCEAYWQTEHYQARAMHIPRSFLKAPLAFKGRTCPKSGGQPLAGGFWALLRLQRILLAVGPTSGFLSLLRVKRQQRVETMRWMEQADSDVVPAVVALSMLRHSIGFR